MNFENTSGDVDCYLVSAEAKRAITQGIERGDCVVEMEVLGLSQRTVNSLEKSEFEIVTLEQLVNHRLQDLMTIPNLGKVAIDSIYTCLSNYHKLDELLKENEIM